MDNLEIKMPRLGVNDDYVVLKQWVVKDGDYVKKGQVVASVETTKKSAEIQAEKSGIIHFVAKEDEEIRVGDIVAVIGEGEKLSVEHQENKPTIRMTQKAKKLLEEYQIDIRLLPTDRLIKEKDIALLVKKPYMLRETKNNDVLLYGAAGFAKIAIDILRVSRQYFVYGIADIQYPDLKEVMGVPVISGDEGLAQLYAEGYRKILNCVDFGTVPRRDIFEKLIRFGFEFPNVIHPSAILEPSVTIGEGNLICAGAIIGSEVRIGSDCVINAGAILSHECIISDHCHIAGGAVLAGLITVGENTLIGQNCTIYSRVKIGSNVVIQNGCNIFKDVPDHTVVKAH